MTFRPWCPICDRTSSPDARECERCGLRLYPSKASLAKPHEADVVELRPRRDDADDLGVRAFA